MGDFTKGTNAAKVAVKKVYYVLKRQSNYPYLAKNGRSFAPLVPTNGWDQPVLKFDSVQEAVTYLRDEQGVPDVVEIVRVEETAGTASRRMVSECTQGAKYAVYYSGIAFGFLESPERGWTSDINSAALYDSFTSAVYASGQRMRQSGLVPHEIVRVAVTSAAPIITETVLA